MMSRKIVVGSTKWPVVSVLCLFAVCGSGFKVCDALVPSSSSSSSSSSSDVPRFEGRFANGTKFEIRTVPGPGDSPGTDPGPGARPVVSKCCNLGYGFTFDNKSTCVETDDEFLPEFQDLPDDPNIAAGQPVDTRYEYYIGDPCLDGKYLLDAASYSYDSYEIYSNGTLSYLDQEYTKEEFCIETLNSTIRVFLCFGVEKSKFKRDFKLVLYAVGLLISVPFLLLTAIIYLSIDLLRDLRGKSLSCHVLCLAIGYLCLALVQLSSDVLNEDVCITAGFTIQFFFVAAFFWLNVICYDTWRSIKNDLSSCEERVKVTSDRFIFCYYMIYGFYGPVILSIVSLIMDLEPAIPESYLKPNFGYQSCWFYSDEAALPYFYGPVSFTILINLIFFVLSSWKIYKAEKAQIEYRGSTDERVPKKSFSTKFYAKILRECIYLFCMMGISWSAEVISWALGGSQTIWMVTDVINTLQGVIIFYLFVLRPQCVRSEVKRRIQKLCRRRTGTCPSDQSTSITRHCHTNGDETLETCFCSENNKFIESVPDDDVKH